VLQDITQLNLVNGFSKSHSLLLDEYHPESGQNGTFNNRLRSPEMSRARHQWPGQARGLRTGTMMGREFRGIEIYIY